MPSVDRHRQHWTHIGIYEGVFETEIQDMITVSGCQWYKIEIKTFLENILNYLGSK